MTDLNDELERFAQHGDFEMSWKNALATADRPKNRAPLAAVALAAVAVVGFVTWTAVAPWFPAEAPVDDVAAASAQPAVPVAPAEDGVIRLPVGGAHVWTAPRPVEVLSIVNPDLLKIGSAKATPNTHVFKALRPGRTDVVAVYADGSSQIQTVVVAFDIASPEATRTHELPVGGMKVFDAPWQTLDIVNPDIVEATLDQGHIRLTAKRPGHTDLVIVQGGQHHVESVVVDFDEGRTDAGLVRHELAVGQAELLPDGTPPLTVTIANPDLMRVKQIGTQLMLEGVRPGLTDLLLTYPDGSVEQHRIVVSFKD